VRARIQQCKEGVRTRENKKDRERGGITPEGEREAVHRENLRLIENQSKISWEKFEAMKVG